MSLTFLSLSRFHGLVTFIFILISEAIFAAPFKMMTKADVDDVALESELPKSPYLTQVASRELQSLAGTSLFYTQNGRFTESATVVTVNRNALSWIPNPYSSALRLTGQLSGLPSSGGRFRIALSPDIFGA